MVDVFASSNLFQFPLLTKREDLKTLERKRGSPMRFTGLHNRRLFGETFEKELNRASATRSHSPLSHWISTVQRSE